MALCVAVLTAWLWAVLLVGRALPWQADRWWWLAFWVAFVPSGLWCWRFCNRTERLAADTSEWLRAVSWGVVPFLVVALAALVAVYTSDGLNHLLEMPYWRMPFVAGLLLLAVGSESLQLAAVNWLRRRRGEGVWWAVREALAKRVGPVVAVSLLVITLLQTAGGVTPIGDDLWHYVSVADAFRNGLIFPTETSLSGPRYPVDLMSDPYQRAGMKREYPALPMLPAIMALCYQLFGHNLVAIAVALSIPTALFALSLYAACRSLTGSWRAAFSATALLFLFPVYQIHILGAPEPDGLFVALLLLVAAIAARAVASRCWRDWLALGAVMGLATLTRHEGVFYSAALFGTFFLFHGRKVTYWLAAAVWLAMVGLFALLHYAVFGAIWPTTFYGTVGPQNVEANLSILSWLTLPWYAQAVGVGKDVLQGLLLALALAAALGGVALWRRNPALVFIPLAGLGDLAMGLMVHAQVMQTPNPVEFLRHISSGLAYAALSAACATYAGYRLLAQKLPASIRPLLVAAAVLTIGAGLSYESERLARPEYYFQGQASLLWTGSVYLLPDVLSFPLPLPEAGDPRDGEQLRRDLGGPLDAIDLRRENRSEPFHWTTLMVALFALAYSSLSWGTKRFPTPSPSPS